MGGVGMSGREDGRVVKVVNGREESYIGSHGVYNGEGGGRTRRPSSRRREDAVAPGRLPRRLPANRAADLALPPVSLFWISESPIPAVCESLPKSKIAANRLRPSRTLLWHCPGLTPSCLLMPPPQTLFSVTPPLAVRRGAASVGHSRASPLH